MGIFSNPGYYLKLYAVLAPILLVGLTFHEYAHARSALLLGDDTAKREGRVTLNPLAHLDLWGTVCFFMSGGRFAWAKPVPVNPANMKYGRWGDLIVSIAGPASNVVLAILLAVAVQVLHATGTLSTLPVYLQLVISLGIQANIFLALFNLLPIFPLDGFHVVKALLPLNQAYSFAKFNEAYGPYLLFGIIGLGWFTGGKISILSWVLGWPGGIVSRLLTTPWFG